MPKAALTSYIQPAYRAFYKGAETLKEAMEAHCHAPNVRSLSEAKEAFKSLVLKFSSIEILHFGPAVENYRLERLNYWPDRKGRGIKRLRKMLKTRDRAALVDGALLKKSVAIQGLPALEYILFGRGAEALNYTSGESMDAKTEYRCMLGTAITRNIAAIAGDLIKPWEEGGAAQMLFTAPGPKNERYRTRLEVISEIYKSITAGLTFVHDLKVLQLLGETALSAKPKRAAFWRSGMAMQVIKANIAAIDDLALKSGFKSLLPNSSLDLNAHAGRIIQQINTALDRLPADPALVVHSPEHRKTFKGLLKQISHINAGYSRHFAIAADLPLGFNAADGD